MRLTHSTFCLLMAVFLGCSDGPAPSPAEKDTATTSKDTKSPQGPVGCTNACKRQPLCVPELVTEQDCLAVCENHNDPDLYACCIQTAPTCAEVTACTDGTELVCRQDEDPWLPLAQFEECSCGEESNPTPNHKECKNAAPDHPCETEMCIKPVNFKEHAFCGLDCTLDSKVCPSPLKCVQTPKTSYCYYP